MNQPGRVIVLEGPDGVGKSTLSKQLARELLTFGIESECLSFPGRTPGSLGNFVYELHHTPTADRVDPLSLQLLHLSAHIDCITNQILPALQSGKWVILDRYWWSMWVYGKVAGIEDTALTRLVDFEIPYWKNIKPTIFLIDRRPIADKSAQALRREYRRLARRQGASKRIDNSGSLAAALNAIISSLRVGPLKPDQQFSLAFPRFQPHTSLAPAKPTAVYDTYWRFAAERQNIFFRRLNKAVGPWTQDSILKEFKFTNAYRAADRASQYLIRNVIYKGNQDFEEVFFRTLLFKIFNRIETWELLEREFGTVSYSDFNIRAYDRVFTEAKARGNKVYSAAYIMPTGGQRRPKHQMHLDLLKRMMADELPLQLQEVKSMGKAFDLLLAYPSIGNFLAYQFITDLNYSANLHFSEMEFTVPGPGAMDGIRKCFSDLGGLTESEIIKMVADRQEMEFKRLGINFKSLWGRPLQLIDCQNIFCEVDKYSRVAHPEFAGKTGRTRIKQKFSPDNSEIDYWFPPKWGINTQIASGAPHVQIV